MGKHKGRAWHSRLLAAALGVTALAAATSVWTAQADTSGGRPSASVASPDKRDRPVAKVAAEIAHASDRGARGVNITIDDGP
ncbi:polysaccharide deacetylase family protein, partial [Streptomyces sp. SID7499]|nr:polysaccharide deacetylase family protein [Streptomyces sp. SID7499]